MNNPPHRIGACRILHAPSLFMPINRKEPALCPIDQNASVIVDKAGRGFYSLLIFFYG